MPSLDFAYDLTENLEKRKIGHLLALILPDVDGYKSDLFMSFKSEEEGVKMIESLFAAEGCIIDNLTPVEIKDVESAELLKILKTQGIDYLFCIFDEKNAYFTYSLPTENSKIGMVNVIQALLGDLIGEDDVNDINEEIKKLDKELFGKKKKKNKKKPPGGEEI